MHRLVIYVGNEALDAGGSPAAFGSRKLLIILLKDFFDVF